MCIHHVLQSLSHSAIASVPSSRSSGMLSSQGSCGTSTGHISQGGVCSTAVLQLVGFMTAACPMDLKRTPRCSGHCQLAPQGVPFPQPPTIDNTTLFAAACVCVQAEGSEGWLPEQRHQGEAWHLACKTVCIRDSPLAGSTPPPCFLPSGALTDSVVQHTHIRFGWLPSPAQMLA
jgi:hypothetical protein